MNNASESKFGRREFLRRMKRAGEVSAIALGLGGGLDGCFETTSSDGFVRQKDCFFPHSGILGDNILSTTLWTPEILSDFPVPLPFIFISHGFSSFAVSYAPLANELAKKGYAVAALNHVGDRLVIESIAQEFNLNIPKPIPFDRALSYFKQSFEAIQEFPGSENQSPLEFALTLLNQGFNGVLAPEINEFIEERISYRLGEANSAFKGLENLAKYDSRLKGTIDLSKLGLLGHSLGGYTVAGMSGACEDRKQFDFSKYSPLCTVLQAPACGIYPIDSMNCINNSILWMVGEKDKDSFNLVPKRLFEEMPLSPQYFLRMADAGHLIFDELGCLFGAGEVIPREVIDWFSNQISSSLCLGDVFRIDSERYAAECANYKEKQSAIKKYICNFFDAYIKGDEIARSALLEPPSGRIRDYFVK